MGLRCEEQQTHRKKYKSVTSSSSTMNSCRTLCHPCFIEREDVTMLRTEHEMATRPPMRAILSSHGKEITVMEALRMTGTSTNNKQWRTTLRARIPLHIKITTTSCSVREQERDAMVQYSIPTNISTAVCSMGVCAVVCADPSRLMNASDHACVRKSGLLARICRNSKYLRRIEHGKCLGLTNERSQHFLTLFLIKRQPDRLGMGE
ncbi:hypothetical protein EDC04DRAFT_916944 [Pisolithus marmoratus]|nr:hypothetical protein EDC04DRAFT_916944 [Pisolithus marmoratus]